ncbi:3-isopropylmalate dehydratase small subunit [Salidesulfovibrio onnuriiensis]|uniref:3-isopropylmalate dehydratase small subunit n=1 Tax=Salidesulfovibrio onnuriiensis TaxID=2583823 RepID=UPI0011C785EB|nr:3-isopropylmalate dehydratase small subunit [Salidesulfovibrio onnuriiensis]
MKVQGTAHRVGDHIDTDAIIPARFLVTTDPDELGANCMEGLEAGWGKRLKKNDVIVAGENFGCGSSREHAPISILGAGVPVVVAKSFARIFYRNGFNMGLVLLEVGDDIDKIGDTDTIEVDTEKGEIRNMSTNETIKCAPVPAFMQEILDAGGLVPYAKKKLS